MCSPRLRPAGIVTLVLLGALVGATTAQERQGTAAHVNGRSPGGSVVVEGTQDGVANGIRGAVYEHTIDWSDARLPTTMRVAENVDVHLASDGPGAIIPVVSTVRLEDSEGSWSGLEYGLIEELGTGKAVTRLMVLSGEGAYEGLSAMLKRTYEDADYGKPIFDGYIFEGEVTPMPDALEAFAPAPETTPEPMAEPEPSPAPASDAAFVNGTERCGERVPPIRVAADGSFTSVLQHGSVDLAEGSSLNGVIYEGPPPPVRSARSAE